MWTLKTNSFVCDSNPALTVRAFSHDVALVWPAVLRLVKRGLYATDLINADDVFFLITSNKAVLFVGYEKDKPVAIAVISLQKYPRRTIGEILATAGMCAQFYSIAEVFKTWLTANGIHCLRCTCHGPQARLFARFTDFKPTGQQILELNF